MDRDTESDFEYQCPQLSWKNTDARNRNIRSSQRVLDGVFNNIHNVSVEKDKIMSRSEKDRKDNLLSSVNTGNIIEPAQDNPNEKVDQMLSDPSFRKLIMERLNVGIGTNHARYLSVSKNRKGRKKLTTTRKVFEKSSRHKKRKAK